MEFFYRVERPLGVDKAMLFHRKRARTRQSVLQRFHARVNIVRLAVVSLLKHVSDWSIHVPRMSLDELGCPSEAARKLRASWQINRGPIRDLTGLLESAGAIVVKFDFETPDIDALGLWPWDTVPLIFVNSSSPADRARFSMCHELGHLILHELPSDTMERRLMSLPVNF